MIEVGGNRDSFGALIIHSTDSGRFLGCGRAEWEEMVAAIKAGGMDGFLACGDPAASWYPGDDRYDPPAADPVEREGSSLTPGEMAHNDQLLAQARAHLYTMIAAARRTLSGGDDTTAVVATIASTMINEVELLPRDVMASVLAVALVWLAEQP